MNAPRRVTYALIVFATLMMCGTASAQCLDDHDCTIYVQHARFDDWVDGPAFYGGNFYGDYGGFTTLFATYKSFRIDHPLDPANKYLLHWSVESPEMKNIYDGLVTLDATGTAWVSLPAWFDSLNTSFRYQLTAVGGPGANLYVADEITERRFRIAGGTPNLKVSWQVTGVRHDPGARLNPHTVEEDKPAAERGRYVEPIAYGKPATLKIGRHAPSATQHLHDAAGPSPTKLIGAIGPIGGLALAFAAGTFVVGRGRKRAK